MVHLEVNKSLILLPNGWKTKIYESDKTITSVTRTINRLNNFNQDRTKDIKSAVDYILTHPPQKQVVNNNQIEFIDARVTHSSDLVKLNIYIRRIRNNLFHGGKFQGKFLPDVSRNSILLTSALIILNEWIDLDREIKELFCSDILE